MAVQDSKDKYASLNIKIYGTPGCPACAAAQTFLTSKGIEYTYLSVGKDITPQNFVEQTGSQSVPVIIIVDKDGKSEKHIGWNPELFK